MTIIFGSQRLFQQCKKVSNNVFSRVLNTFVNMFVFFAIFIISSFFMLNDFAAAGEKKGLLSILRTEPSGILSRTIYFIKRNIWIQSLNDTILLIVRVLGSR